MTTWDLAKFTPEQTARYMAGGELGRPQWADPAMQRKQDQQRARLRAALQESVALFTTALQELSPQTAPRLQELAGAAFQGDPDASRMFMAMYGELITQALRP